MSWYKLEGLKRQLWERKTGKAVEFQMNINISGGISEGFLKRASSKCKNNIIKKAKGNMLKLHTHTHTITLSRVSASSQSLTSPPFVLPCHSSSSKQKILSGSNEAMTPGLAHTFIWLTYGCGMPSSESALHGRATNTASMGPYVQYRPGCHVLCWI